MILNVADTGQFSAGITGHQSMNGFWSKQMDKQDSMSNFICVPPMYYLQNENE